ncbi:MAG: DUF4344 domain-containing metallopeptidase [Pseudomonadota bacterium]
MFRLTCLATCFALPAFADEGFVEANIIGIFYHELGHAVIDIEEVPIFGQEEDAADVFSIFMIDALFEEDSAIDLAYAASFGFLGEVEMRGYDVDEIAWWDTHGPDEQRFYNTVCIFYGADPDARADFAADMGLPEDRADWCPEEYDQANGSWGVILDDMLARGGGTSIRYDGDDSLTGQIIAEEVTFLNEELQFAAPLNVVVESCGEANAFYDPSTREVIMCLEFEDHLFEMAEILN